MYFDAILNQNYYPVKTGPPAEIREYLEKIKATDEAKKLMVCPGATLKMMTVRQYLNS